jgi:hypothetical protein
MTEKSAVALLPIYFARAAPAGTGSEQRPVLIEILRTCFSAVDTEFSGLNV